MKVVTFLGRYTIVISLNWFTLNDYTLNPIETLKKEKLIHDKIVNTLNLKKYFR